MENDLDDLDNLFDDYESITRPEGEENSKENPNDDDNTATNEAKAPERVPVPKRIVRNPRLKFDAERLCGQRGIPVLADHFKNVKFKGKGHEKEDLNKLLSSLTHWCHRLYPSMKFDDCLRQIEKLGKKRPVQTCLRKIRLGMPILHNDFIHDDEEEENQNAQNEQIELPPEDEFDRLFNETREASNSNFTSTPISKQSSGNALGSFSTSNLTEEQRQRMEYNRLLAAERRKSKLESFMPSTTSDSPINSNGLQSPSENSSNISTTINEDSHGFGEEIKTSELKSIQNMDNDFVDSENLAVNSTEIAQSENTKESEELGLEELMDLVNDEDTHIVNEKIEERAISDNIITSNVTEQSISFPEDNSEVDAHNVNEKVISNSMTDTTVPLFQDDGHGLADAGT